MSVQFPQVHTIPQKASSAPVAQKFRREIFGTNLKAEIFPTKLSPAEVPPPPFISSVCVVVVGGG